MIDLKFLSLRDLQMIQTVFAHFDAASITDRRVMGEQIHNEIRRQSVDLQKDQYKRLREHKVKLDKNSEFMEQTKRIKKKLTEDRKHQSRLLEISPPCSECGYKMKPEGKPYIDENGRSVVDDEHPIEFVLNCLNCRNSVYLGGMKEYEKFLKGKYKNGI